MTGELLQIGEINVPLVPNSSHYEGRSKQHLGCWNIQQQGQVFTAFC